MFKFSKNGCTVGYFTPPLLSFSGRRESERRRKRSRGDREGNQQKRPVSLSSPSLVLRGGGGGGISLALSTLLPRLVIFSSVPVTEEAKGETRKQKIYPLPPPSQISFRVSPPLRYGRKKGALYSTMKALGCDFFHPYTHIPSSGDSKVTASVGGRMKVCSLGWAGLNLATWEERGGGGEWDNDDAALLRYAAKPFLCITGEVGPSLPIPINSSTLRQKVAGGHHCLNGRTDRDIRPFRTVS